MRSYSGDTASRGVVRKPFLEDLKAQNVKMNWVRHIQKERNPLKALCQSKDSIFRGPDGQDGQAEEEV